MEKQEIINNLYAIRAGMSYVVLHKEAADQAEEKAESQLAEIMFEDYDLSTDDGYNEYVNDKNQSIKRNKKNFCLSIFMLIGLVTVLGAALWGLFAYGLPLVSCTMDEHGGGVLLHLFVTVICLFAIGGAGFGLWYVITDRIIWEYKIQKEDKRDLKKSDQTRKKYIKIMKQRKAETEEHNKESIHIYDALIEMYGTFLDVCDWQYVDLLIYYLQTGRADTMKEALQLVDRQIQTQMIVNAVNNASRELSKTIKTEIGLLETTLNSCAQAIINNQHIQIGQSALQNALLAKISWSSQALDYKIHA